MRDRAFRRAQTDKWKRRVEKMWKGLGVKAAYDSTWLAKMTQTRKPCSCEMCGNERRHFGHLSIQELKHDVDKDPKLDLE